MKRGGVRLTGGAARGRPVRVPLGTRPTEGRVREALFSRWAEAVPGGRVLDLFAGSGAVGLEAAGRGALAVVSVEQSAAALSVLSANVDRLGGRGVVEVRRASLPEGLGRLAAAGPFDLIFADPPYAFARYAELLAALAPLLAPGGEAAVEHSVRSEQPAEAGRLVRVERRRYGESALTFYRAVAEG